MLSTPEVTYIGYYNAPYGTSPQPRTIPEGQYDIEIITSGRGFYEYEGKMIEVLPGTILWHGPNEQTIYMNDSENPYQCLVIVLKIKEKPDVLSVAMWSDRISFQIFLDNITHEYHKSHRDMIKLSYYIYGQLYWQSKPSALEMTAYRKRDQEIKKITAWIDNHYAENIALEELAEIAELSVSHLHAVFKELTSLTPYQFIQNRRILEAKKLLASTRLSVKEVSHISGFNDLGNFCRTFKKMSGVTAQKYRELHTDRR